MSGLVKHYQNTMQGIPQLSNNWGSMISLLDAVLVTGFNVKQIASASVSGSFLVLEFVENHGFIERQVVEIYGANAEWNGEYRVVSAAPTRVELESDNVPNVPISGTPYCKTPSLGYEIVFSDDGKRAYKSTSHESMGLILRIEDFCASGASATGSKFAKVAMCDQMVDIDNITGVQVPYDNESPDANWQWDGTRHGWAKWYYATTSSANGYNDTSAPTAGNRSFLIVGDANGFVLDIACALTQAYVIYGFFDFDDTYLNHRNTMLLAFGLQSKHAQNTILFPQGRSAINFCADSVDQGGSGVVRGALWFNQNGLVQYQTMGRPLFLESTKSGVSTYVAYNINISDNLMIDFVLLDNLSNVRGVMPFVRTHASTSAGTISTEEGLIYKRFISANNNAIKHAVLCEKR